MRISYWSLDVCSSDLCSKRPLCKWLMRQKTINLIILRPCHRRRRLSPDPRRRQDRRHCLANRHRRRHRCRDRLRPPSQRRLPHCQPLSWALLQKEAAASISEPRSEEHTSELQSLMRISYAVFCLKKKTNNTN